MAKQSQQNNGATTDANEQRVEQLMAQVRALTAERNKLRDGEGEQVVINEGPTATLLNYLQTSNEALIGGFNNLVEKGVVRRSKAKVQSLIDFALFIGAEHRGGFLSKEKKDYGFTSEDISKPAFNAGWIIWLRNFTSQHLTAELTANDTEQALSIREGADAVEEVISALFILGQAALFPKSRFNPHLGAKWARKFSTNTTRISSSWADPCEFEVLPAIYDFIGNGYKLTTEQRAVIESPYPQPTEGPKEDADDRPTTAHKRTARSVFG